MSLFNDEDVAAADEDPFGLSIGRRLVTISKSEEDSAEWEDKTTGEHKESRTWVIEFHDDENGKTQNMSFFLDGTAEQIENTNGKIKALLLALDIPRTRWGSVSANPAELVGTKCIVEVGKSAKTGRKWLNVKGLQKETATAPVSKSSVETTAVAGGAPKSNPFLS